MRNFKRVLSLLIVLVLVQSLFATIPTYAASVVTYSNIASYPINSAITMTVNGVPVTVQNNVDGIPFARFAMSGPVTVVITVSTGLSSATIRPLALGLRGVVSNNQLTFTLNDPKNFRVDLNNVYNSFFIFADPLEVSPPQLNGANVKNVMDFAGVYNNGTLCTAAIQSAIDWVSANHATKNILYFPDGTYKTGSLNIKDYVQVYLSSGALIKGSDTITDFNIVYDFPPDQPNERAFIILKGIHDAKLFGRGTIDANGRYFGSGGGIFGGAKVISVYAGVNDSTRVGSSNISIQDVMETNAWFYQWFLCGATDLTATNLKAFTTCANGSTVCNTDGYKVMCGTRVNLDGAFLSGNDDSLTTGADGPQADGDLYNCTVNNVTVNEITGNDNVPRAILRIAYTNRFATHDITFSNIMNCQNSIPNLLFKVEDYPGYNYSHPVTNMTFKNWVMEGPNDLMYWDLYNDSTFSYFDNWLFQDITIAGNTGYTGYEKINGTSVNHKVTNFTFNNVWVNGVYCESAGQAGLYVDPATTSNIVFTPRSGAGATVTTTSIRAGDSANASNDGNYFTFFKSAANPTFPQYVTYVWSSPQTLSSVNLISDWCAGQAPTSWDIEVSADGSTNWTPVASSGYVSWAFWDSTRESKRITANASNIKGMRVKINSANLTWSQYQIDEIQAFVSGSGGPFAFWKFDENSGNTLYDSSGYSNTATNNGCVWQVGKSGYALNYNGSSQYVDAGNPSSLNFSGQITVGGWVWIDSVNSESVIAGKGWDGSNTPWWLSLTNGSTVRFGTYQGGMINCDAGTGSSLVNNGWHHIVGVYDGTAYRVYIDGTQRGYTNSSTGICTGTNSINIGRINEGTPKYFDGVIDQLKIYNRGLSASEISSWYSSGQ